MRDNRYPESEYEEELDQDMIDHADEFVLEGEDLNTSDKIAFIAALSVVANAVVEEETVEDLPDAIVRDVVALLDNESQGYHVIPRSKENMGELAPMSLSERLWDIYMESSGD